AEDALAQRVRLASLSAEVGTAMARGTDLGGMLQRCCEAIVKHLEMAFARVWMLDEHDKVLHLQASAGMYRHTSGRHSRIPVGQWSRLILDPAYDAFVAMDASGRITDWNIQSEILFGWSRTEALGRLLCETIIPPEQREGHRQGLSHFLSTGQGPMLNRRLEL